MDCKFNFNKKTFAVISGASQGIGRTIAIELATRLKNPSTLLLIARSEQGLLETKKLVKTANESINVIIYPADLSKLEQKDYDELFKPLTKFKASDPVEVGVIFHNAGQIGELNKTTELNDMQVWRSYYDLNVFSVALMNSAFLKKIHCLAKSIFVVNTTSLCGRQPFKNLAMYGSAKAARDLFFKVLAEEEKDVVVLNYSPGPVRTAMVEDIIENVKDQDIRDMYLQMGDNILSCEQTVGKLMGLLEEGDFASGDTVDYYDKV